MDLANFSEELTEFLPVTMLSLALTVAGSLWIDRLYLQEQDSTLLSFPEQVTKRAKYRKILLFLLLVFCFGKAWNRFSLPVLFYYVAAISFLSFVVVTDFEQYVIFDNMLLPFSIIGLCYTAYMNLPLFNHIAAALSGGLLFLLLAIATKGAIGGGDIKLIAAMGLWLGIRPLLSVIGYGFLTGGAAALFLLLTKQKQRHDFFAYGPYFALSGIGLLLEWFRILF